MQSTGTPSSPVRITITRDRFEALKSAHGITSDQELAEKIGVNKATLYRVREGKTTPSAEFLARVVSAFPQASLDHLFTLVRVG